MSAKVAYLVGAPRSVTPGRKLWLLATIAVALLMGVGRPLTAFAAPGDLDTTFSGDGKQTTDFFGNTDGVNGVAIQADGKFVVGGFAETAAGTYDFALARYNPNGSIDNNFDGDGKVTTDFQGDDDIIAAVVIQTDGKILVAGYASTPAGAQDLALARYNPDGSLDNTFSGNGKLVTDINGGDDLAAGMAVQTDGKIVIAGAADTDTTYDFVLARYNTNGGLDTTFSGDGKVVTDFGGQDLAYGVALQTDGKIVAGGIAGPSLGHDYAVARYDANGTLDTTFSFDGKTTVDFSSGDDLGLDVLVQPDGKIVMSGYATYTDVNFGLARFLADGTLDTSFSGNGKVNTDFGADDAAYALLLQSDNKFVAVGYSGTTDFAVARYNTNGGLDTSFSFDGKVNTPFSGGATAGLLQPDGKIVAAGYSGDDVGIARYQNDPPSTPTPTITTTTTRTSTRTATTIVTATRTRTPTPTSTLPPTQTPNGPSPTRPATGTRTTTPTRTNTATATSTPTNTHTPLPTQTPGGPTATPVPTETNTSTPSHTPTNTPTSSPTNEPVGTSTPTACPLQFEDVPSTNTFYANVRCLACRGIVSGYPCGGTGEPCNGNNDPYFRPGNLVTRGQIAKIASNSAGFSDPVSGQTFEDVAPNSTFYIFVERLVARGVMSGYACGGPGEPCNPPFNRPYFRTNSTATRGQLAKITSNAANFTEPVSGQTFEDVLPNSTFYEFIERLASRGVMSGYACGGPAEPCVPPDNRPYFRPNNNVTRGQTSKIVGNTFFPNCYTPARSKEGPRNK
jgi:uncharacterized delta-60 repeat protein